MPQLNERSVLVLDLSPPPVLAVRNEATWEAPMTSFLRRKTSHPTLRKMWAYFNFNGQQQSFFFGGEEKCAVFLEFVMIERPRDQID